MNSFAFYLMDANEIISIINSFESKSSSGFDNIPVSLMKCVINNVEEPTASIVNCFFRTGTVPDLLKIAKVCLIFEGGLDNLFY